MKKFLSIYGLCTAMMMVLAIVFKSCYWPGGILYVLLTTLMAEVLAVFYACYLIKDRQAPKGITWLGAVIFFVLGTAVVFKTLQWPGGTLLMLLFALLSTIEFIILVIRTAVKR